MIDLQLQAVEALRSISRNEKIKKYLLQNPSLYKIVLRAAMRFIGGETLAECFHIAQQITVNGHAFTIDFIGESTRDEKAVNLATEEFLRVVSKIKKTRSTASISLDLSHIGSVIDKELGHTNAVRIAEASRKAGIEMMISMEGIDRTDSILEEYFRLSKTYENVGITIQAYLHRTKKDLQEVLKRRGKIRLVKGAYKVPETEALPLGSKTDKAYKKYIETILSQNYLCSIATHDENLLMHADTIIKRHKLKINKMEFEMLHGVTPDRLLQLHQKGYKTREYLPYGKEWYLYLCHRLAENPANIYQALADAAGNVL
ncbi:hypothetical protein A3F59_02005 [Candidatus Roizmanbacteria bacterium RIFCSPHIGHO2_12_FULL_38_13]|nr:MAG: hypothetical protein A2905_03825 [Candidatus Levybacteria bacterium RIFCSPLOWO2_01_FULL_36_10]OGK35693.1 MAG: hypothetical protein A3F59_02005 [Candidatus Roizmanbacteria bacterium RIFCSPHIGHO2_12_FULL_38_13]